MGSAVPNVLIDPLRTCLFWVSLRVNTGFFQSLLEDRVLESNVTCSMLMIESIVAGEDIVMAPAKGPSISGQHARVKARVPSPLHHGDHLLVIVTLVQLEKPRPASVGFPNILNAITTSRRKTVGKVQLFRNSSHR